MSHARSVWIRWTRDGKREGDGCVFVDAAGVQEILMQRSRYIAHVAVPEGIFTNEKALNKSFNISETL